MLYSIDSGFYQLAIVIYCGQYSLKLVSFRALEAVVQKRELVK